MKGCKMKVDRLFGRLFFIITFFVFWDSIGQNSNNILIVESVNSKNQNISIFTYELINYNEIILSKSKIDSLGNAKISFSIEHPQFLFLKFGNKRFEFFFIPNDTNRVFVDFSQPNLSLKFRNKNASINNYLIEASNMYDQIAFPKTGKDIVQVSIEEFIQMIDSIEKSHSKFHKRFIDSTNISSKISQILEATVKLKLLSLKMNRYLAFYNPALNKDSIPPDGLKNLDSLVPLDTNILYTGLSSYKTLLNFYKEVIISKNWHSIEDESINVKDKIMQISFNKFDNNKYQTGIKEYLLGLTLYDYLSKGISTTFKKYSEKFDTFFPNSRYSNIIKSKVEKINLLIQSKIAPNFWGETSEGKIINLHDLKDKILYVDFWATWCSPCIKEFPNLTKLQSRYRENKNVIFLFVSIDKDKLIWKNYLSKHKELLGLHINISNENIEDMSKNYSINEVPRYILFGKNSQIIDLYADKPSSQEIIKKLDDLLTN